MEKKIINKGKRHEDNCSIDSLCNSTMSYPTWEKIKGHLGVQFNNPESFGEKPLTKVNVPIYSTINEDIIKEHKENTPYGIDIPVLLEPGTKTETEYPKPKPLIVIVGESALRTKEDLEYFKDGAAKNVILGTPYAIHLEECPPKCGVYRKIFDALLSNGYSLYITDIIKVWWKEKNIVPDINLDIPIFREELNYWNDVKREIIIVAWGEKAKDALRKKFHMSPNDDFLPLPHPSTQNWDAWKLRIFEKAVFSGQLKYATDLYGKKPDGEENKTTAEKVATEVFKSIEEYVTMNGNS